LPVLLGAAVIGLGQEAAGGWPGLCREHLARHPEARAQDLYKLLYQGVMGSEHAVSDPEAAERGIVREMDGLEPNALEPLTEPCDPEGVLVRVNLRPYKALGGQASALARAFVQTARESRPDADRLASLLADLGSADLGNPQVQAELRSFRALAERLSYPPMSHSDAYREAYRPAYRVVLSRLLPELGISMGPAPTP
jgi:hypothetical protein